MFQRLSSMIICCRRRRIILSLIFLSMLFVIPTSLNMVIGVGAFQALVGKVSHTIIPPRSSLQYSLKTRNVWRRGFAGSKSTDGRSATSSRLLMATIEDRSSTYANNKTDTSRQISTGSFLTNQQIVERRLAVARGKREARERTILARNDKNFRIKRLLHTEGGGASQPAQDDTPYPVPPMYSVKVWVEPDFRQELRLSGREKRGRVFIEADSPGVLTLKGLKQEIHGFFSSLKKNTYLLRASYPSVAPDGTLRSPDETDVCEGEDSGTTSITSEDISASSWPIESDDDVIKTFQAADEFFQQSSQLKRPAIQICVLKDRNAPPPPPPPEYLIDMADPKSSPTMTMISFYAFPPNGIQDPDGFAMDLSKKWKPFAALGRVYVAGEGVNAQMSVPTNVLPNFMQCCRSIPELKYMENDINVDPKPLTTEEFAVAGVPVNGKPAPPFKNLHIRVRNQIVADGLLEDGNVSLDWQSAGYDMPPLEWHEKIKQAKLAKQQGNENDPAENRVGDLPIILDCRNKYETDVGIFEGAEPLDTENFRDSWDVLKARLEDTPKDAPIMTYCTGGIRCVKVGAYLTQELGFTNVSRLAGGIIAYDRTISEKQEEESMFKGTNFVFDGRLGRQITEDALGVCTTCGAETSLVSNCRNDYCHKRMTQCEQCRTSFHGTCSQACKQRLVNGHMTPQRRTQNLSTEASPTTSTGSKKFETIEQYCSGHSSPAPSFYKEMELNTQALLPSGAHMVSGADQGRLLTQLSSMTRDGRILELGTFSGYATACFLEGASNAGRAINSRTGNAEGGPYVLTMERDNRALSLASAHLRVLSEHGLGEAGAEAAATLRGSDGDIPDMEGDLVSLSYDHMVGCDILRVTDALATIEAIGSGKGLDTTLNKQPAPFDLVFVDADKTRMLDYVEACLKNDLVLKPGGYIVVDNVLWKGLVLEAASGSSESSISSDQEDDETTAAAAATTVAEKEELRKNRRARKLASQMHAFNAAIIQDNRVEVLMYPMRDGLSVIRKK